VNTLRLPRTAYVILGLLTFEERSGYDLRQLIKRSITHFYWDPAPSQLYSELRRLEAHGLVTMREIHQTHRPTKRLYAITPAGMAVIRQWLGDTDLEPDTYKSAFLMKAFLGHLLPHQTLTVLFKERRRQIAYDLQVCQQRTQDLITKILGRPELEEKLWFPLLPLQRCIALYQAEIAWLDEVLAQLKQRRAKNQAEAGEAPKKKSRVAKHGPTRAQKAVGGSGGKNAP
jgi:DNA-binding PadR family transcriptional regulator